MQKQYTILNCVECLERQGTTVCLMRGKVAKRTRRAQSAGEDLFATL